MSSVDRAFEAPDLIAAMDSAVNYNQHLIESLDTWSAPFQRVLDFGAGNGRFATALHRNGRTVLALEPDPALRESIRGRGVATGVALEELADQSVDAVYSINVLEHIDDHLATLRQMRRVLRTNGGLFLYVPAFMMLFSANDRRVGHVRRYRRGELASLVRAAGFTSVRARYADSIGFFAAVRDRFCGDPEGGLNLSGVRAYDRYVFPISKSLDRITGRIFGKNVVLEATADPNAPAAR